MAEENKQGSVKVNEDAPLGPAGKQVKPASQQSSKDLKASIVHEDSRELHPSGEPGACR
jgi:hypothetical protein